MFALILRVIAFILFVLAGLNQALFGQPSLDEIAFGLAALVLADLLAGYGPASPLGGRSV